MKRGRNAVMHAGALALGAAVLAGVGGTATAQSTGTPPAASSSERPATRPAAPRTSIQLPPAERQALEAAASGTAPPARVEDALAPTPEDIKPRTTHDADRTRIEQVRVSNRVREVIVTPAGQSHSYVMTNREGRQPYGTTQMNPGLSVPMFFRFEFGRSTPPATNPPPPPTPSPSR